MVDDVMKYNPRIYADFHNADSQGRLRLDCNGTKEDLAQQKVELRDGLRLSFYSDDLDDNGNLDELIVEGEVTYSDEAHCWVAMIDWNAIRHESDTPRESTTTDGNAAPAANEHRSPQ